MAVWSPSFRTCSGPPPPAPPVWRKRLRDWCPRPPSPRETGSPRRWARQCRPRGRTTKEAAPATARGTPRCRRRALSHRPIAVRQ
eukprot:8928615-Pyramimonas_sp.AAC.1